MESVNISIYRVGLSFSKIYRQFPYAPVKQNGISQNENPPNNFKKFNIVMMTGIHEPSFQEVSPTCIPSSLHSDYDVRYIVQRVKHTEDIHTMLYSQLTESARLKLSL